MSDVVDLNAKRLEKVTKDAATGELTTEVVQLLACSNCASSTFRLAHDNTILCAQCCIRIGPLRWYDVNLPEPSA